MLPGHYRQVEQDPEEHGGAEERHRRQTGRSPPDQNGVERPAAHADEDENVAPIRRECKKLRRLAPADDRECAAKGDRDACELARREPFFQEQIGQQEGHDRQQRIDECRIHDGRVMQRGIDEAVEGRDADRSEQCQKGQVGANARPVLGDGAPAERDEDQQGEGPAPEAELHWRDGVAHQPGDQEVARPEQRRKRRDRIDRWQPCGGGTWRCACGLSAHPGRSLPRCAARYSARARG